MRQTNAVMPPSPITTPDRLACCNWCARNAASGMIRTGTWSEPVLLTVTISSSASSRTGMGNAGYGPA